VGECNENNNTAVTGQFWVLPRIAWPYGPRTPSFNFGPLAEPTLFSSEVTLDAATIGTAVCARVRVELEDDSMAADLHASLSGPVDFQTPAQQPPTGSMPFGPMWTRRLRPLAPIASSGDPTGQF
jgi:hypothetical protein